MSNVGKINDVKVDISDHALTRMCEMGMTADDIKRILFEPEDSYNSTKYPGDVCYRSGRFALATRRDGEVLVIKTALYPTLKDWLKASLDGELPPDREFKPNKSIPRF